MGTSETKEQEVATSVAEDLVEKPQVEVLVTANIEKSNIEKEPSALVSAERGTTEKEAEGAMVVEDNASAVSQATKEVGETLTGDPSVGDTPDNALVDAKLPSYKEESYFVEDLKDYEKKALQELRHQVEEGIKTNAFILLKVEELVKVEEIVVEEKTSEPKVDGESEAAPDAKEKIVEEDVTQKIEEAIAERKSAEAIAKTSEENVQNSAEPAGASETIVASAETETLELTSVEGSKEAAEKKFASPVAVEDTKEVPLSVDGVGDNVPPIIEEVVAIEETIKTEEIVVINEDLSLWGVPLLHSKGDPRTDVILLKFLRARDFKVTNSFAMLKNTILWRKKFGADGILEEDFGTDFDKVAYLHGVDKEGHPVSYNDFGALNDKDLYQKAFGDQAKTERFLRWRVQLLEKSIKLLSFSPGGVNAVIQVIDLKNSPWLAKKELRIFISQALSLLQDNYPELVVKMVLINVPWYFSALFSIISPFLTQRTRSKFVVLRGGKVHESLFKLISPDQVPVQYCGLSRVDDKEFGDAEAPVNEVSVKAGQKQTVGIEVPEAGGTVLWDLTVIGWDISYGAEFVPSAEGSYTTIIEKTKKITSFEGPVRITFKALEAGKVVLVIDNTSSRKKKIAHYRYLLKQPALLEEQTS